MKRMMACWLCLVMVLSLCTGLTAQAAEKEFDISASSVQLLGRGQLVSNKGYTLNFPQSGFSFYFVGTTAKMFTKVERTGKAYVNITVDDGDVQRVDVSAGGWITLAENLPRGGHTVKVTRSNEVGLFLYAKTVSIDGFTIIPAGEKTRKMEFVGDSYTVGYGNMDEFGTQKDKVPDNTDSWYSYATVTARRFGAQVNLIASSGKGLYANLAGYANLKTMAQQYELASYDSGTKWDFTAYIPQVVVVFLGTNDESGTNGQKGEEFYQAYCTFLENIKGKYPTATVICCAKPKGGYGDYVERAVTAAGGEANKIHFFRFSTFGMSATNSHPNIAEDQVISDQLASYINQLDNVWQENPSVVEEGATYYVSPDGKNSNPGTVDAPFATLQQASSVMLSGDRCYVREGVYREVLKPKSGTAFLAYPGETPVISACEAIEQWIPLAEDHLYEAPMNWTLADQNMVLVNGDFAYEARWPDNAGSLLYPTMSAATDVDASDRTKLIDSALPDGINPVGSTAWILGGSRWIFWNRTVTGYDAATHTITLNSPFSPNANNAYDVKKKSPYVLMGKREFLSCQNEWYYDKDTKKLIMWSINTPASMNVEVKKRTETVDLSGVENVTLDGLTLIGGRITSNQNTAYCTLNNITARYAAHSFKRNVAGHQFKGHHNLLKNSDLSYASFTLLQDKGSDNRFINNKLTNMNYNSNFIGSINLAGNRAVFSHNTVSDGGRELLTLHNGRSSLIQYNDLFHSSTMTWDTAAIYTNMTDANNTVIRYNTVHDTISSHLGMGIYLDPCVQNYIIYGNVIWNMTDSAIRLNNPANYILVYNNTSYKTGPLSSVCSGARVNGDLYGTRFVNNLFDGTVTKSIPDNTVFQYNLVKTLSKAKAKWDYTMDPNPFIGTVKATADFKAPEQGDFRLQDNSPYLTAGTSIDGIESGSYMGAYAPGASLLDTGCHPGKQYDEYYESPNVIYMNRIRNAAFGYGDLRYWTTEGANVSLINESSWSNVDARTRAGNYSVCLGAGENTICQKITGLSKNTTYTLSGWAKVEGDTKITMGVREVKAAMKFQNTQWERQYLTFQTGDNTEVTIYYQSSGTGKGYCGDAGLAQTTIMSEAEKEQVDRATLAEDQAKILPLDDAAQRRITVEDISIEDDGTATLSLANYSKNTLTVWAQFITYRRRADGADEFLSMQTVPVSLGAGSVTKPTKKSIVCPYGRKTEKGDYRVLIRLTDHNYLSPIGQAVNGYYTID